VGERHSVRNVSMAAGSRSMKVASLAIEVRELEPYDFADAEACGVRRPCDSGTPASPLLLSGLDLIPWLDAHPGGPGVPEA
jgi:hypothetical protein